jgi:hypothetical protein
MFKNMKMYCNRCQKQIKEDDARYIYYQVLCKDCADL